VKRTDQRAVLRRRRHRVVDGQHEHDQSEKNVRLEADLVAGLERQKEAEERDEEDEEAREDEVDDVEQTAATQLYRERDVRLRHRGTAVSLRNDPFHVPSLHSSRARSVFNYSKKYT